MTHPSPIRTTSARVAQNRQFAAVILGLAVYNVLLALVHTLEANNINAWVTTIAYVSSYALVGAWMAAVAFAVEDDRLVRGIVTAVVILATQTHIFFIRPALVNPFRGWALYVSAIVGLVALSIMGYLKINERRTRQATVSSIVGRASVPSHRRAA